MKLLNIRDRKGVQDFHEVSSEVFDYVNHLEMALENEQVKKAFYKKYKDNMKDKVVEQVKREYDVRSSVGIKKYGTTLEQNNTDNFLQHLKEELMDAVLYLQKLQNQSSDE